MSAVIEGKGGFRTWLNKRLPVDQFMADQLTGYYAPKNFNIWYFFGSLALLMFVMQIVTGIFVTMHFKPGEATAWNSVQFMVREVPYMWLIQPMHAVGASFFFIVVYLHMARGMLYGSYKSPRELLWVIGMLIYLALMAEAFMGYVLPNGNMSYWGAQVIINLFGTIPGIGRACRMDPRRLRHRRCHADTILLAARRRAAVRHRAAGDAAPGRAAPGGLQQSGWHRDQGKTRQDGKPIDGIPFHPYYTLKDIVGVGLFLTRSPSWCSSCRRSAACSWKPPNFEPANPVSTPEHIAPVWYFTPYYAILRAVPDQKLGALLMALSVVAFLFLPWLDRAKNKSIRYRGWLRRSCSACSSSRSCAHVAGPQARRRHLRAAGTHLHGAVFPLLHPSAVRVQGRRQRPGSGTSDLPCP